jgi:hypothetical protein
MNADNRWKRKADALARLAEDQAGKPEGELAKEKLRKIIAKHPEAKEYPPIKNLSLRGIDLTGSWSAGSPQEAVAMMFTDYRQRAAARAARPKGEIREAVE